MNSITNDHKQRQVILIFGDPGQGKSHLAGRLREDYGYSVVSLDDVYVEFVRTKYPALFLPALRSVIAQHYNTILVNCDQAPFGQGAVTAWREHVAGLVESASQQHGLVVVEGYLLLPALDAVQEKLGDTAVVKAVEVRHGRYFTGSSISQIHRGDSTL